MFRIGIVGCGKIAEKHLSAYRTMEDVEILVSDADVARAEDVARAFRIQSVASPEGLIKGEMVDGIDVCVPTPFHAEHILAAIDAGKHVFCEKPLVETLDEALEIRRRATETGAVVMVGYLYRFHPSFELAKRALVEGAIGDPYFATLRLGGRGSHRAWKHWRARGGGAVNEMLVHMLDLALWYFGEARAVDLLRADTLLRERYIPDGHRTIEADAEDFVLLEMQTMSGCRVLCQSDLITPGYMNHVEIQGTNGSIFASIVEDLPTTVFCKEGRAGFPQGSSKHPFERVDLFRRELAHFVHAASNGTRPRENSLDDSIALLRVIEEVRAQMGAGR